ncbi:MAG: hypothetical protein ACOYVK_20535 [Bacillota bacterium]
MNNVSSNIIAGTTGFRAGYEVGKHTQKGDRITSGIIGAVSAVALNTTVATTDSVMKLGDRMFGGSSSKKNSGKVDRSVKNTGRNSRSFKSTSKKRTSGRKTRGKRS